jgi:hypothetical protein
MYKLAELICVAVLPSCEEHVSPYSHEGTLSLWQTIDVPHRSSVTYPLLIIAIWLTSLSSLAAVR